MAGEIDDPIRVQVDCLPTGSISFGRFEEESLDWERRSSFSHNRYLEEVKKYSRPGSVTEKKAYFEAHFKRKALSRESSSESQNGIGNETTENCTAGDITYVGELEDHGKEDFCNAHYEESPSGSGEHEYEVIEFEREEEGSSGCEFQAEPMVGNTITASNDAQKAAFGEILQTQFGQSLPSAGTDTELEIEQKLVNEVGEKISDQMGNSKAEVELKLANEADCADILHKKAELLLESPMDGINHVPNIRKHQKTSLDVKFKAEQKTIKSKGQKQLPDAHNSRKVPDRSFSSSAKAIDKIQLKSKKESSVRTKADRGSPLKVPPTTSSLQKNVKSQDFENVEKLHQENNSGKGLRPKKVSSSTRPTRGSSQSDRPQQVLSSRKPDSKLNGAVFNFKSEERAEKRKEFHMKLEEKQHAKEVKSNQIQARTQEETEAEIKQLRRSLNFKATPMPSFYHGTLSRGADGKKAVINHAKSPKSISKHANPGKKSGSHSNSPASSRPANQRGQSAHEQPVQDVSLNTLVNGSGKADEMEIRNQGLQAGKKTEAAKKERGRGNASSAVQRQQGEGHAVRKGESTKASRVEVGKKAMNGIVGRGSEMNRLTVHVAS